MHHLPFTGASLHYGTQIWPSIKSMNFRAWPVINRQVQLVSLFFVGFCLLIPLFVRVEGSNLWCWSFRLVLKMVEGTNMLLLSCVKLLNTYLFILHTHTHTSSHPSHFRDSWILTYKLLVASASCCVSLRFPTTEETVRSGFSLLQTILRSLGSWRFASARRCKWCFTLSMVLHVWSWIWRSKVIRAP